MSLERHPLVPRQEVHIQEGPSEEAYVIMEAQRLLDGRFTSRRTRKVLERLLGVVKEKNDLIRELKLANRSFPEVFDQLVPEMEKAVKQAQRYGAEKALGRAGVLKNPQEKQPELPFTTSEDDEEE